MEPTSRENVIAAIDQLLHELRENPESWENPTLERYLSAIRSWLEDSGHKVRSESKDAETDSASWALIVDMLYAGQVYE